MIKVLIVDDSVLVQQVLKDIVSEDPMIEVVGTVSSGKSALELIPNLEPDVITLDLNMPDMDGREVLQQIMLEQPTPCLIISKSTHLGTHSAFEALDLGAVDFIGKPGKREIDPTLEWVKEEIKEKVRAAHSVNIPALLKQYRNRSILSRKLKKKPDSEHYNQTVIVIGVSTGGPKTLPDFLPQLTDNISCPIVVFQHIPEGFSADLAKRLDLICSMPVKEAHHRETLQAGTVYIAPGGKNLTVKEINDEVTIKVTEATSCNPPDINLGFNSFSQVFGPKTIGIILTGMGDDGSEGLATIRRGGGYTIAQDPETAILDGMPKSAIRRAAAHDIVTVDQIVPKIKNYLKGSVNG